MREELQRRLEEIMELVRQRDEIELKLMQLLGDDEQQDAPKKRARHCGGCGSKDHDIQSCPKYPHPNNKKYSPAPTKRGTPKPCCGSVGVRHKKTCPQNRTSGVEKDMRIFTIKKTRRYDPSSRFSTNDSLRSLQMHGTIATSSVRSMH
jgi:hypothetical protein